jgi:hypothetical protein
MYSSCYLQLLFHFLLIAQKAGHETTIPGIAKFFSGLQFMQPCASLVFV